MLLINERGYRLFFRRALVLICLTCGVLSAQEEKITGSDDGPWLTGTLLAPVTSVVTAGNIVIQPFLYVLNNNGLYDPLGDGAITPNTWSVNPSLQLTFGLTEWMDFEIIPQVFYQNAEGASAFDVGDTLVGVDFQLFDGTNKVMPSVLLSLEEIMPTGKYQRLNPAKNTADSTGKGSWISQASLVFYKLIALSNGHYLSAALDFTYSLPTHVYVNNYNAYGGGPKTKGQVTPGNYFTSILSFEYTLTKNWVLALDSLYIHSNSTGFQGTTSFPVGGPSSDQLSFTPAIEYNFNKRLGVIAGAWFTAWGKSSSRFAGAVVSLSYVYSS